MVWLIKDSYFLLFSFAVPEITVGISSSTQRLLDVPPYNRFVGSCVASVSVDGLEGPAKVATVMQWQRKGESDSIFNDITDNTFINNGLMTTLQYDEAISGNVTYQCVSILEGVDNISNHDEITVSVVGELQKNQLFV